MKQNVGGWDKNMRLVVGGGLLATALMPTLRSPWRLGALMLAASGLITATTRYCPLNEKLGIDTSRERAGLPPTSPENPTTMQSMEQSLSS